MFKIVLKLSIILSFSKIINANSTTSSILTAVTNNYSLDTIKADNNYMFYIVGGYRDPRKVKFIKYMVSMRSRNPQRYFGDNHFCAGTIISKTAILTAAHCVMDKRRVLTRARRILLVAGTPNRLVPSKTTVQYPAKSISAHTNFIRKNQNDIAIIHMKGEVPDDNNNIRIMKMATGPPPYGANCTIIGWGRMLRKGPLAALPLHVDVFLFYPFQCKYFLHKHYHDGVLCAGASAIIDQDPCRGDSGGPLICNGELTGIISWTIGCGSDRFPSIFSDVWYHRDWIAKHLNKAISFYINYKILFAFAVAVILMV